MTVAGGVYEESLTINRGIVLKAESDGAVTLQPPAERFRHVITVGRPIYLGGEVEIRGIVMKGTSGTGIGLEVNRGSGGQNAPCVRVIKCTVMNCGEAIHLRGSVYFKTKACEIRDCDDGLIEEGRAQATLHSTTFHKLKGCGACVTDRGSLLSLKKCIMTKITGPCVSVSNEGDVRITNSVLVTAHSGSGAFLVKAEARLLK